MRGHDAMKGILSEVMMKITGKTGMMRSMKITTVPHRDMRKMTKNLIMNTMTGMMKSRTIGAAEETMAGTEKKKTRGTRGTTGRTEGTTIGRLLVGTMTGNPRGIVRVTDVPVANVQVHPGPDQMAEVEIPTVSNEIVKD